MLRHILSVVVAALPLFPAPVWAAQSAPSRQQLNADAHWKFLLGDPAEAQAPSFNDSAWRTVDLPHDWSIEGAPAEKNPTGSGGGFFPAGVGWYRRTFMAPPSWKGKRVSVEFDGVASNATVYLNGKKLGIHPYAYTTFRFDLTPALDFAQSNVLAVRVDNSELPSSRWFTGAGIYRHVRIVVTEPSTLPLGASSSAPLKRPPTTKRSHYAHRCRMTPPIPPTSL
jgi:beta-galactosidase